MSEINLLKNKGDEKLFSKKEIFLIFSVTNCQLSRNHRPRKIGLNIGLMLFVE